MSTYYLHCAGPTIWDLADVLCYSYGYDLVSIRNASEDQHIQSHTTTPSWIGLVRGSLSCTADTDIFWWVDGYGHSEVESYCTDGDISLHTNWAFGEPDGYYLWEDCIQLTPNTGMWSTEDCYEMLGYVCARR